MPKEFIGTCVDNPFGRVERLDHILDNAKKISKKRFLRECEIDKELVKDMRQYPQDYQFFEYGRIMFFEHSRIDFFYKEV